MAGSVSLLRLILNDFFAPDAKCTNPRHVERKVHKMRELRVLGSVALKLVPTKAMEADALTKPLDDATFERHRAAIMNLAAAPMEPCGET